MTGKPTYEELEQKTRDMEKAATERERMLEASLWQSAALEQSIDGIVVTDPDGDIRFVNNSFAVMHGYSPEGLV
ncbi:MAG: PAS domain S-box protein, partial [Desulfobacterales bacterium]|nr:PAS domain S-box protein [Desulfobacterales bacterium]